MTRKYIDKYGTIWEQNSKRPLYVWNQSLGLGLFNKGRGLTPTS